MDKSDTKLHNDINECHKEDKELKVDKHEKLLVGKSVANASKSKTKNSKIKFNAKKYRKITDIFQVKSNNTEEKRQPGLILVWS